MTAPTPADRERARELLSDLVADFEDGNLDSWNRCVEKTAARLAAVRAEALRSDAVRELADALTSIQDAMRYPLNNRDAVISTARRAIEKWEAAIRALSEEPGR